VKIIQVVPRIHEEASGPSYSVPRLAQTLGQQGADVTLHVLAPAPSPLPGCQVRSHPGSRFLPALAPSASLRDALCAEAPSADIMHNHSLWLMPNVYPAWAVRGKPCRLVTSPRGTLSAWALDRSRGRKRLMWWLFQRKALHASHCFHATAEKEYQEIRDAGLRGPVTIIPNGIDLPCERDSPPATGGRRRLLFFGRIHPTKGIDILLRAWQSVQQRFPEWELQIGGPDEGGHRAQLEQLVVSLALERVTFTGPAYGADKSAALRSAELFVLPSHTENFGVAVAEALAHSVPAVVSKGAPWQGLEPNGCGWWVDRGAGPLADCLSSALALPRELLREKGRRGRCWVEREFSWEHVGRRMLDTYRWLLGGGTTPPWVRTD
jgi:glycosyltransferase involved in cell wall biosynthesis